MMGIIVARVILKNIYQISYRLELGSSETS